MKVEGAHFVDEEVKKMKKKDFINMHKNCMFLKGRKDCEKESILSDIYDKIVGIRTPSEGII